MEEETHWHDRKMEGQEDAKEEEEEGQEEEADEEDEEGEDALPAVLRRDIAAGNP